MSTHVNGKSLFDAVRTVLGFADLDDLKRAQRNWMAPLLYYQRFIDQDRIFAHCARRGVEFYVGVIERRSEKTSEDRVRQMIAKKEVDEGFPGINAYHTANLWNMVDATLSDVLANLFETKPESLTLKGLRKVSFSLAEYEETPKPQRMRIAVTALKRELVRDLPKLRKGVEVYEEIFRQLGITKRATKVLLKRMTELRAARNVIVHSMSIADSQFVEQCPWLRMKVGALLKITDTQYESYMGASGLYLVLTFSRLLDRFPESGNPAP